MFRFAVAACFGFLAQMAQADTPRVVTDIAPVHSLVMQVMGDGADVHTLVPANANAHNFALRPSDAGKLSKADVVIWIGPELTPSLEDAVETLAADAMHLHLLDAPGTHIIEVGADGEQDHDGEEHHDDHDDHAHADAGHNDDAGHDDHGHHHAGVDPHAWLDPHNAELWLEVIADALSDIDPDNAAVYQANAAAAQADLDQVALAIKAQLANPNPATVVVFHDTLRYFDHAFQSGPFITVPLGDGRSASVADVIALRTQITERTPKCALVDPGGSANSMMQLAADTGLQVHVLDPLGGAFAPGADLYTNLLRDIAETLSRCH